MPQRKVSTEAGQPNQPYKKEEEGGLETRKKAESSRILIRHRVTRIRSNLRTKVLN